MTVVMDQLEEQIKAVLNKARDVADRAEQRGDDFTPEERNEVQGYLNEARDLKKKLNEAKGDADIRVQITELGSGLEASNQFREPNHYAQPSGARRRTPQGRSGFFPDDMGGAVVDSKPWNRYFDSVRPVGGHVGEKTRITSPQIFLNEVITGGDATSGGAFVVPDQSGILVPMPMRERTLLDLVTRARTTGDLVEYVRVTDLTNNAAGVAESDQVATPSPANAAAGVKPWSDMAFERVQAPVQTIAHGIPVTKRALSDAAQIRSMIDAFLRDGLLEELERQVIDGTGTGEEIEGFDDVLTLNQAYSATVADLSPLLETTRKALTKIQLARGLMPTGFVFHPTNWEAIDLARMAKNPANEGTSGGVRTLHGYPVVLSEAVTVGWAYCGDFRQYVIWDREQTSVTATDGYMDFFMRNMVAILAEMRAAGGLLRTDAICKIDLTA